MLEQVQHRICMHKGAAENMMLLSKVILMLLDQLFEASVTDCHLLR